jgi:hypothetical protein
MTGVEITECGRTVAGDVVAFTIEWQGEPSGEVVWGAQVSSADGDETVALCYARGSSGAAQYVEAEGRRSDVDLDADVGDGQITARFPAEKVGVAVEWPTWTAVVAVDGQTVAQCVMPAG